MSSTFGTEFYLYIVNSSGWEDLSWYTESGKEKTEAEALQMFLDHKKNSPNLHLRLYKITRPLNKKTMIADSVGN